MEVYGYNFESYLFLYTSNPPFINYDGHDTKGNDKKKMVGIISGSFEIDHHNRMSHTNLQKPCIYGLGDCLYKSNLVINMMWNLLSNQSKIYHCMLIFDHVPKNNLRILYLNHNE